MKPVLVTGGGGFVGRAIIRMLLSRGVAVRSFSRRDYPELRDWGVETHRGDLTDGEAVTRASSGCEAVFHVAAKTGVWGDKGSFFRTNVRGTENVLAACRRGGVRRLIFTSSPSVVFEGEDQAGLDESAPYPTSFLGAYPETKALAEQKVLEAGKDDLATVALRPHLVWGPQDPNFLPRILERGRAGRLVKAAGGPHWVDSVYIDNAAEAHVLAWDRLREGADISGRAYFITQGQPLDVAELMDRILGAAGLPPIRREVPPRLLFAGGWLAEKIFGALKLTTEPPLTRFVAKQLSSSHWFDITAARRDLGYEPRVSLDEGMDRLARWLRAESVKPAVPS